MAEIISLSLERRTRPVPRRSMEQPAEPARIYLFDGVVIVRPQEAPCAPAPRKLARAASREDR